MVNDLNVEELLIQTNPVLDPEELRLSANEVDARCASILERRGVMQTQTPSRAPTDAGAPRRWRKPAFAFMVGLLVILIAAGGVALLIGGGDPDVIEEPAVTTAPTTPSTTATATTPTTTPATLLPGPISAPSYAEVPSFAGTVEYFEHDPSLGDPGWQATVVIKHAGPMLYEAEVTIGGPPYLGNTGSVFLGDGATSWLNEFADMPLSVLSDFDHFSHLYFDSQRPYPPWDEMCGPEAEVLGTEVLLARTVTHVACSTLVEDHELWVDEESGLVLKMAGPLGIGDYSPSTARDGGFVFTELTFEPVTIAEPPAVPTAQTGEFPPFHMIRTEWPGVVEWWYRDDVTLRETFIEAEDERWIDTFVLVADGRLAGCSADSGGCYNVPLENASDIYPIMMPYSQVPLSLVVDSCSELGSETVAGRSARHFVCDGLEFVVAGQDYYASANEWAYSELWFDTETALLVREGGSGTDITMETTLLEVNPAFPVGIFEYEEMEFGPGAEALEPGEIAPLWHGPLIGGGEFDLANYVGSGGDTVVVFNWFPTCGDSCLEGLDLMQRLHDEYDPATGSDIVFVTVSEDIESETARLVQRRGNTVPAVYCVVVLEPPYQDPACATSVPGVDPWEASPWFLWGNPIPSITVIDSTGVVIGVFTGYPSEYEADLEALLGEIAGVSP
ncbi:MAG: hypothetical protein OER12_06530 [Acidimicrobiia bacterium]|nr:hypothetical protein [Acidimicrobiia bacterium]